MIVFTWLLNKIGGWLWPVVGVAFLVSAATAGWYRHLWLGAKDDLTLQGAQFNEQRLLASKATAAEERKQRDETYRRTTEKEKTIEDAQRKIAALEADAVINAAASGRLSQRLAAFVAAAFVASAC